MLSPSPVLTRSRLLNVAATTVLSQDMTNYGRDGRRYLRHAEYYTTWYLAAMATMYGGTYRKYADILHVGAQPDRGAPGHSYS